MATEPPQGLHKNTLEKYVLCEFVITGVWNSTVHCYCSCRSRCLEHFCTLQSSFWKRLVRAGDGGQGLLRAPKTPLFYLWPLVNFAIICSYHCITGTIGNNIHAATLYIPYCHACCIYVFVWILKALEDKIDLEYISMSRSANCVKESLGT